VIQPPEPAAIVIGRRGGRPLRLAPATLLALFLVLAAATSAFAQDLPFEWVEVADDVYAALKPEPLRFNDSNSLVIVNERDVVVVDAQAGTADVEKLIAEIDRRIGKPVRFVVNTHWHGDHTQGNAAYLDAYPRVDFIGHRTLSEDVPNRAGQAIDEQIQAYVDAIARAEEMVSSGVGPDGEPLGAEDAEALPGRIERARVTVESLRTTRFVSPTVLVESGLTIYRGDREIRILHFRGHTRGDLVVHLPRERVLAAGDLLDDLPYGGHGYPAEWIESLRAIRELEFDTLVPGHGRVRRGREHFDRVLAMFEAIVAGAREAAAEGLSLERARERIDLSAHRDELVGEDEIAGRAFDEFVPATIERAYLEARGELPD
jgi:glyoxylase-like metal-dependent hydrolase (beta-lactamase superfamily II)